MGTFVHKKLNQAVAPALVTEKLGSASTLHSELCAIEYRWIWSLLDGVMSAE